MIKKNELEIFLEIIEKLINKQAGKGVILHKNTPNEVKMSYKTALKCIKRIETYFGLKGASSTSFNICNTCTHWNQAGHSSVGDSCGSCKINGHKRDYHSDIYHAYDTCDRHSLEGGGQGL